jgi:oxygen-independent coproporphyrinogen-3 oxidase
MTAINSNQLPLQIEELSTLDQINESIMTSLRTMWGLDLIALESKFGQSIKNRVLKDAEPFLEEGNLVLEESKLRLTDAGKLMADHIRSDLFVIED